MLRLRIGVEGYRGLRLGRTDDGVDERTDDGVDERTDDGVDERTDDGVDEGSPKVY
jgi:hypothetical protein